MSNSRQAVSAGSHNSTTLNGRDSPDRRDEVFGTIGQQVERLGLKDADRNEDDIGNNGDPEDFSWGNEKVVEVVESLCMNCQENVGHQQPKQYELRD